MNLKSDLDRRAYNKQRNICVSLIRQEKKSFFSNLKTKDVNDNKTFWKTVKHLFTDKVQIKSKITLIEKKVISKQGQESNHTEKIISDDKAIAEVFNKFFINIVPNLKIPVENNIDHDFTETDDLVLNAINKFKNHPSIIMIKRKNNPCGSFSFSSVQYDDILKKTKNLDTAKASQESDIPTKILKENCEFFAQYFCGNINYCICHSILASNLKSAGVTAVYKND